MDTAYHSRPRRLVLLVSTFLALLAQPAAWAEGVVRKVGVVTIVGRDAAIRSPLWKILTDVARSTAPDSNITFEFRSAEGNNDRYPQIVNDLVEQRADVIFAGPGAAAIAAQKVTTTVPVVFAIGVNPVALGLIKSLKRPGTNMTGLYEEVADGPGGRMSLLKEMAPQAKMIGILWDAQTWPEQAGTESAREAENAVLAAGARATIVAVRGRDDLQRAFSVLSEAQVDGLLVLQSPVFFFQAKKIGELAAEAKIPAVYTTPNYVEAGGLASLGGDLADNYRLTGGYIGRILTGENPADLPILRPPRTVLTINSKAARELGVAIPPHVQTRADRLID
jgi:putative ABC transport system substrate-binding protein